MYANNSIVTITDIGIFNESLFCTTTYSPCCTRYENPETHWYYPNGSEVLNVPWLPYFRTRYVASGSVQLSRNPEGTMTGIFHCDVPDANGTLQSFYVGIYTSTTGQVTIPDEINFQLDTELTANTTEFTLTCPSTGGPATTVSWTRGSTMLSGTSQIVNTETGTYENTLRVTMKEVGMYVCTVSNNRSSASRNLTVEVASPPTNLSAVRLGPTNIQVSWTAPATRTTVMGYRIYYTEGTNQDVNSVNAGASATNHTITIPQPQSSLSYSFTIVALSSHLPSTVVGPAQVTVDPLPTRPAVTTPGTATPTSVVLSWNQQTLADSYEISFQRATGNQQFGDCSSFVHSGTIPVGGTITTYNLTGLQEFSTYFVTVNAVSVAGRTGSNILTVNTKIAAPTSGPQMVTIVDITSANITIAWDAVSCIERNSMITGYVVYFTQTSTSGNDSVMVAGTGDTGGRVTINGLTPSTLYSIQVAAVNNNGNVGELSTPLIVYTSSEAQGHAVQTLGCGSLAGAVVGACIGTALLYTVVLLVVIFTLALWRKRHREMHIQKKDMKPTQFDTEIAMNECIAYGGVAADYENELQGDLYEKPI